MNPIIPTEIRYALGLIVNTDKMKKNTSPNNRQGKSNSLIRYTPPVLKKNSAVYIEYKAMTPQGVLKRDRIYYNRFRNDRKVLKEMTDMAMIELSRKLASGWSPFMDQEPKSYMTPITEVVDQFTREKSREMRKQSIRSLNSKMNNLKSMFTAESEFMSCLELTPEFAKQIMREIYSSKNISPVTYNNYLNWCKSFGSWCVSAGYMKANPFSGILSKKAQEKSRKPIPEPVRLEIFSHFSQCLDGRYISALMVYFGLRQNEVLALKVGDVDIKRGTINIDKEVSKNGNQRCFTIPSSLTNELANYIKGSNKTHFLISDKYRPGKKHRDTKFLRDAWNKMRKELNIPTEYKFYSLRDTGIIDMINQGVSVKKVMDQVGHSSLDITTIYAKHINVNADPVISLL